MVDADGRLRGLITVKDIQKQVDYPDATKDERGRLRVGAAVGVGVDALERAAALIEAGVDVLVVDTAHGHSHGRARHRARIKSDCGDPVIAGNIATGEAAEALIDVGADCRQGRRRARLDLHDPSRRRCRRAAGDSGLRRGARSPPGTASP